MRFVAKKSCELEVLQRKQERKILNKGGKNRNRQRHTITYAADDSEPDAKKTKKSGRNEEDL